MKNLLIIVAFSLASCLFHQKALQLPEPQARPQTQAYFETVLKPDIGTEATVSIGDLVLSYTRLRYSAEMVLANAPSSLLELPLTGWDKTHEYQSKEVYTNPAYYDGNIGAVLDSSERVVLYVQTSGVRAGRRWRGSGTPFFGRVMTTDEDWRLRYSGRNQTAYKFEIVNTREDKAILATQSFEVSEESFLDGFVVRGVLVKGTAAGTHGTIFYRIVSEPNE